MTLPSIHILLREVIPAERAVHSHRNKRGWTEMTELYGYFNSWKLLKHPEISWKLTPCHRGKGSINFLQHAARCCNCVCHAIPTASFTLVISVGNKLNLQSGYFQCRKLIFCSPMKFVTSQYWVFFLVVHVSCDFASMNLKSSTWAFCRHFSRPW